MYISDSQILPKEYVIFVIISREREKHILSKLQISNTWHFVNWIAWYHLQIANNCLLAGWVRDREIFLLLSEASSSSNSRSLALINISNTLELSSSKDVNYVFDGM